MSYHYQVSTDFFESTSYLPQSHNNTYESSFYPSNDGSLMMPAISSASTQLPSISTNLPQAATFMHQTHAQAEPIVPYGWRSDWCANGAWPTIEANASNDTVFRTIAGPSTYYFEANPVQSTRVFVEPTRKRANSQPSARNLPKPFKCQVCFKAFSQAANLTAHKRIHTGEKPFSCSICHRPFSQSSSLVTHKRTHTGERPYPCLQCDKAFTDSSTLTKHLRTHSGQKPYGCPLCLMRFTQSGNLHRHMKTHKSGINK